MNIDPQNAQDRVTLQQRAAHTTVWVTFDKVGFHCYPDAPAEVAYLRDRHRHVFKFLVEVTVFHDDREIEFHMFKNWLTSLYDGTLEVDYKSCEMLAQELLDQVVDKYDCTNRMVRITVSEDGECGATLTSNPMQPFSISRDWIVREAARINASRFEPGQEVG